MQFFLSNPKGSLVVTYTMQYAILALLWSEQNSSPEGNTYDWFNISSRHCEVSGWKVLKMCTQVLLKVRYYTVLQWSHVWQVEV